MTPRRTARVGFASATRRGFTLVEVVTAMGISSIVLVALGSSILIASRAMPPANDPASSALNAGSASGVLADDLRYATAFSVLTATAVEFTVPDRTGDGAPELIRYEWSGVAGAPLRRQMNVGSWTTVVSSVSSLALSYNTKSVSTTTPVTTTTTSPEYLFAFFDGWSGVSATVSTQTTDASAWGAEFFTVDQTAIPADARTLQITRVRVKMKQLLTTGNVTLGIYRSVGGGNPQPAVNPQGTPATLAVSSLPTTSGWVEFIMPSDVSISYGNNKDFVFVVKGTVSSAASMQGLFSSSAPKDSIPTATWTTNGGGSWSPAKSSQYKTDFNHYVYGTYTTSGTVNVTTTTKYLQSVGVLMQPTGATNPVIATAVEVYGHPQVTLP